MMYNDMLIFGSCCYVLYGNTELCVVVIQIVCGEWWTIAVV